MSSRGAYDGRGTLGEWNAICDQCGRRFKASDLRENWRGLRVCPEDWEPRHPADFFRIPGEKITVPFARPDDRPERFGTITDAVVFVPPPDFIDTSDGDPPGGSPFASNREYSSAFSNVEFN